MHHSLPFSRRYFILRQSLFVHISNHFGSIVDHSLSRYSSAVFMPVYWINVWEMTLNDLPDCDR